MTVLTAPQVHPTRTTLAPHDTNDPAGRILSRYCQQTLSCRCHIPHFESLTIAVKCYSWKIDAVLLSAVIAVAAVLSGACGYLRRVSQQALTRWCSAPTILLWPRKTSKSDSACPWRPKRISLHTPIRSLAWLLCTICQECSHHDRRGRPNIRATSRARIDDVASGGVVACHLRVTSAWQGRIEIAR
jgi:hypothetical protein